MVTSVRLAPGRIAWVDLGQTVGREQAGRRPCIVIASADLLEAADSMAIVIPCTTTDRGWSNHVELTGPTGLSMPTFAVTEQPRAVSRERMARPIGSVDDACLTEVMRWVGAWLHPAA